MKKVIAFLICSMLLLSVSLPVLAGEGAWDVAQKNLITGGEAAYGSATQSDLPTLIGNIVNAILALLGIIMVVYIIWGGWDYMKSEGKEETKKATQRIVNATIGLLIVFAAYAISSFVLAQVIIAVSQPNK